MQITPIYEEIKTLGTPNLDEIKMLGTPNLDEIKAHTQYYKKKRHTAIKFS